MEIRYFIVIENKETKYLKTKISPTVMDFMLVEYTKFYSSLKNKEDYSFQKYLIMHGIECVYDGAFGYIDVDDALSNGS